MTLSKRALTVAGLLVAWLFGCGFPCVGVGAPSRPSVVGGPGWANDLVEHVDRSGGFAMRVPTDMRVDRTLGSIRTVFSNAAMRIEVYVDDFRGTRITADSVIGYGNRFARNRRDHEIEIDQHCKVGPYRAHLLQWSRRALQNVPDDFRFYASVEMVENPKRVATVLVKSRRRIDHPLALVLGFRFVDVDAATSPAWTHCPSQTPMDQATRALFERWFNASSSLRMGIFQPGAPDDLTRLHELESLLGRRFDVLLRYQGIDRPLPMKALAQAAADGRVVELTLQTVHAEGVDANANRHDAGGNASLLYDLLDGRFDQYLRDYAAALKSFGRPVLLRFDNEMNGDWCWYSAFHTGKDAGLYGAAWRHVHHLFATAGVNNVLWVWNPHDRSFPAFKWNHALAYYPGDAYVDIVGLTGYNNGTYFKDEQWREFSAIYGRLVGDCQAWFDKPLMITEFAASSVGGDKVRWLKQMWRDIRACPAIKVAVWWNSTDFDEAGRPARLYRLDENKQTLAAFREGLLGLPRSD